MQNFEYHVPTKVFFGKDTHLKAGRLLRQYNAHKVLLVYGSGSIKRSGVYDTVVKSLHENNLEFIELGGVEPNPTLSFVHKGIELARKGCVDFLLAVGGGSVIDTAKVIGTGAKHDFDPWLFHTKEKTPTASIPLGTIVTIAASGSEMNESAVLTNQEGQLKRGQKSIFNRPVFSILNPELTFSVSPYQTSCGTVDIMMHTLERYICESHDTDITDRLSEALLKSVIQAGETAYHNPLDYEARATLMWAGSLSHNNLMSCGRGPSPIVLPAHQIEHEISGKYDYIAHGAGLAVLFPALCEYVYKYNVLRIAQYAVRVWNCEMNFEHPEDTAITGIKLTKEYFESIGMPVTLKELGVAENDYEDMADKCTNFGQRTLNAFIPLGKKEIIDIFNLCKG